VKAAPSVINTAVTDRIIRERTFPIVQLRGDRKDAYAQILITLEQILSEGDKFTGQLMINVTQGTLANLQVKESQKVDV